MRLLHYNPMIVAREENYALPGMRNFAYYFKIYNPAVVPVDRTNTLSLPIHTASMFPLPTFRPFTMSYEDVCNARAIELLKRSEMMKVPLYIFWSGGIDSTLALISLLKNALPAQRSNITVLMSEDSIVENPRFYQEHILGKFQTESSNRFPYLLGGKHIIVNGECNDQVFGSDAIGKLIQRFGDSIIHQPYDRTTFFTFFDGAIQDPATTDKYLMLFEKLARAAPIPIVRNYDFLWWINFALKWQNVFMRTLTYTTARNIPLITPEYVHKNYAPFYCTDEFQLWSMHNPDKKIKDTWKTYKWAAKEVIYDYTKDADYRDNKVKRGSLYHLIVQRATSNFVDENFQFSNQLNSAVYYNPQNDFV